MARVRSGGLIALIALFAFAACSEDKQAKAPDPRPVRTVVALTRPAGETVVLTGRVAAEDEAAAAFRLGGRLIERTVNVGDAVKPGQLLAKLDPQNEVTELRAAQASLAAAQAQLNQARPAYQRQRTLLSQGHTPRAQYDLAMQALENAQAQVDAAEAQVQIAAQRVSWTMLTSDVEGVVTARGAEPGEVVQAGRMIVQIARKDGRDAVFDVPAQVLRAAPTEPEVTVRLTEDPSVMAKGRVRQVAPQADPVTRTFEVKVALIDPPPDFRLGSTVSGRVQLGSAPVITIPASALTRQNTDPAVWVVDPKQQTVAMRPIEVVRFDPGTVVVSHGLADGDIVVTAGVQALHPGQRVRLVGLP